MLDVMSNISYKVKKFNFESESDVSRALSLLEIVFNKKFTREWWEWKYRINPFGESIGYYTEENDSGVMSSLRLFWNRPCFNMIGKVKGVYQAGDTATHPDYQQRGLAKVLVREFLSEYRHLKIYNFPNDISKKIYLSNGWDEINKFFFKVVPFSFFSNISNLDEKSVTRDENFKLLTAGQPKEIIQYYFWRFVKNPLYKYYVIEVGNEFILFTVFKHKQLTEFRLVISSAKIDFIFLVEIRKSLRKLNLVPNFFTYAIMDDYSMFSAGIKYGKGIYILSNNFTIDESSLIDYQDVDFV